MGEEIVNLHHHQQILSELSWERDVVVPDLENRLSAATNLISRMTECYYNSSPDSNIERVFKQALDFLHGNENFITDNSDEDVIPF